MVTAFVRQRLPLVTFHVRQRLHAVTFSVRQRGQTEGGRRAKGAPRGGAGGARRSRANPVSARPLPLAAGKFMSRASAAAAGVVSARLRRGKDPAPVRAGGPRRAIGVERSRGRRRISPS